MMPNKSPKPTADYAFCSAFEVDTFGGVAHAFYGFL
jgi:hypothetical protein